MSNKLIDQITSMPRRIVSRWSICVATLVGFTVPALSYAVVWVQIPDASLVKYQLTPSGQVFFRNLNQFNASVLGCCYNYWIDTTTQNGKNIFALFLAKQAQGKGVNFSVPDAGAAGTIDYVGEY